MSAHPTLTVMVGPPCCGKTTLAEQHVKNFGHILLSADEVLYRQTGSRRPRPDSTLSDLSTAHKVVRKVFRMLVDERKDIVLDGFYESKSRREFFVELARSNGYSVVLVSLPFKEAECHTRAAERGMHPTTVTTLINNLDLPTGIYCLTGKDSLAPALA